MTLLGELWFVFLSVLMGSTVFPCIFWFCHLEADGRKISISSFCYKHTFRHVFYGLYHPFHQIEADMEVSCKTCILPESSSSLQNNGTLSDTRTSWTPSFEKMILNMCFTVELILTDTQIISGHPEKESTNIKENHSLLMYMLSMWTLLHV